LEQIQVELFSDGGNNAVVRMPRRAYPGVVVQGDTLFVWRRQLAEIAAALRTEQASQDVIDEVGYMVAEFDDVLRGYEQALSSHGIRRPY
jgi:hypothetical protein